MPRWVKVFLDEWLQAANVTAGKLFRRVNKNGKAWGWTDGESGLARRSGVRP
jgi:hypothetical protein